MSRSDANRSRDARGPALLAVWMAAAGAQLVGAAPSGWLRPGAPHDYQTALRLLFPIAPLVYTVPAWPGEPGGDL